MTAAALLVAVSCINGGSQEIEAGRFTMALKRTFNIERFFQSLGNNTRLRLLNLMEEHEICVGDFVEILGQPQPKISRHLAYLRSAGIVNARREGTWMHYRIVIPPNAGAAQTLRLTLDWLKEDKAMQADRARLSKCEASIGCCPVGREPGS